MKMYCEKGQLYGISKHYEYSIRITSEQVSMALFILYGIRTSVFLKGNATQTLLLYYEIKKEVKYLKRWSMKYVHSSTSN